MSISWDANWYGMANQTNATDTAPSIAIAERGAVITYSRGVADDSQMYYRVSTDPWLNDWSPETPFGNGWDPAIAMTEEGYIVEIHSWEGDTLPARAGTVNFSSRTITWGPLEDDFDTNKFNAQITIARTTNGDLAVVSVHAADSDRAGHGMWYTLAALDGPHNRLFKLTGELFDQGWAPSITALGPDWVLVTHEQDAGVGILQGGLGKIDLDNKVIHWEDDWTNYAEGTYSSVCADQNGDALAEAHVGPACSFGSVDRSVAPPKVTWSLPTAIGANGSRGSIAVAANNRLILALRNTTDPGVCPIMIGTGKLIPAAAKSTDVVSPAHTSRSAEDRDGETHAQIAIT